MRLAIIGGGIAGLSAAWRATRAGATVVVFEGSERIGGKIDQVEVDGLRLDVGAEALLARRPEALDLVAEVGLADDVVHPTERPAALWQNRQLEPLAPSVLGVPLGDPPHRLPVPADDQSVGEYVEARYGRDVVDRGVEPLLGGVYAGHADDLSLFAAAPQLLNTPLERSPSSAPTFAGIRGGVGRLPDALVEAGQFEVRLNTTVRLIEAGPWRVNGDIFDAVVVATPAPASARILAEVAPRSAYSLAGIEYASVAIATFVLEESDLPELSGFLVPPIDGTAIKAATFSTRKWQWLAEAADDRHVVRASLGRAGETTLLHQSNEVVLARAEADLRQAVPSLGRVSARHLRRWGGALPQYHVGHLPMLEHIDREIADLPGLELCGSAYRGIGIAGVIASANAAVDRIVKDNS